MKPILNVILPKFFETNREYYMNYVKKLVQNNELTNDYHIIVTQKSNVDGVDLEILGLKQNTLSKRQKRNFALNKIKTLKENISE